MHDRGRTPFSEKLAVLFVGLAAIATALGVQLIPNTIEPTALVLAVASLLALAALLGIRTARRLSNDVYKMAFRDELTGLPNRRYFMERLWSALAGARGSSLKPALLLLDLDRFKVVNDTLGHPAGDELLISVSRRLGVAIRPNDVLARLGGDEFAILAEVANEADAVALAEAILESLAASMLIGGQTVWPNASIGIALPGSIRPQPQELLSRADVALYQAKGRGTGQYFVFDANAALPSVGRLSLEAELRTALESDQFEMVYQPMVDLKTMQVAGVEALLRWNHPSLGVLGPDDFLALAEETGISRNLSEWVLTEVCNQAQTWHDLFGAGLGVSVNLSALQFRDLPFVAELSRLLRRTGADCRTVHFEITESALMEDAESTLRNLDELHGLGFKVAIDDFGVGFSSLSYLRRFQVDTLKIDQSFIRDEDCERTLAIVSSVVQLAHALGMSTTAEGIETEDQLQRVLQAGCDQAQGYLLSRPVSAIAITKMLSTRLTSAGMAA